MATSGKAVEDTLAVEGPDEGSGSEEWVERVSAVVSSVGTRREWLVQVALVSDA